MKIARAGLLLAGLLTVAAATTAEAAVVITFDNNVQATGTLSYDGLVGTDPLVGTDITFDIVTVNDGANPETELVCVGCVLDFTTGAADFDSAGVATFTGGGSFVITGTIVDPGGDGVLGGGDDTNVATGTLLSGSFSGIVPAIASIGAGGQLTVSGAGIDEKNADLLAYFGLPADEFIYASTNITATACDTSLADGFDCEVQEADVVNTQQQVPEPGSLLLFGMALVGTGAAARRRFARK